MKLRNKLKIGGVFALATGLAALISNINPESWIVSSKRHEPSTTYPEQIIYPQGNLLLPVYNGRIMLHHEGFKIRLSRKIYLSGSNYIVLPFCEKEVNVSEETYNSVQVGQSGVYTLKNRIKDIDSPVN